MNINQNLIAILITGGLLSACGGGGSETTETASAPPPKSMMEEEVDPMDNIGVGPVSTLELAALDAALAEKGKIIYEEKCTACHKIEKKFIGPSPTGILDRRNPVWIMNMILNPEVMIKEDPIAKQLLIEANGAPMANQNLTEAEARSVLEYFRTL